MSEQQPFGPQYQTPYPQPQQDDQKMIAVLSHVGALVAPIIAPVVGYVVSDNKPFARAHAAEALNFQITVAVVSFAATLFSVLTIGLGLFLVVPAGIVYGVLVLYWVVMAALAASRGETYRYPLTLRLVS